MAQKLFLGKQNRFADKNSDVLILTIPQNRCTRYNFRNDVVICIYTVALKGRGIYGGPERTCSEPIAILVNMSLEQGIVPDAMKLAKVIPIHKSKSKELFNNYRPISLLSNMSKVLEKVVHNRLYSFLIKNSILYDKQYGFRPKRSTIDATTEFTAGILPSLDRKKTMFVNLS